MPGVGDFGAATWLDIIFGVAPAPAGYWLALLGSEPGPSMDSDLVSDLEPTDSGYGRVFIPADATHWASSNGFITTLQDVDFGSASSDWGEVSYFALLSGASSGDLYAWGDFLNPQYVEAGYQMIVPAGGIVATLSTLDTSIA